MTDIQPTDRERRALIAITVEAWRFARQFARVVSKLDAGELARHESQLRWFVKKIQEGAEAGGLRLTTIEGQPFDPGMAATPLNAGDFGPEDHLYVDQMLEPIILSMDGELLRPGTVMLRKANP